MGKSINLKDKEYKKNKKIINIGEPFIPDGTFWFTIHIGKENLPNIRLDAKELTRLYKFFSDYIRLSQKRTRKKKWKLKINFQIYGQK